MANLSRNVVIESADPDGIRGHTMYHRHSAGSISYAEFRHLGKEGKLGKYSIHFHRVGDTMRGSSVIGASIWDSANRWITIHGTNTLVVRDCVGYQSIGHGFFLEDGTEVENILDRNLAVQACVGKPLAGSGVSAGSERGGRLLVGQQPQCVHPQRRRGMRSVWISLRRAGGPGVRPGDVGRGPDGQRRKVDIRTLPFLRFEDNEAHDQRRYGLNLGGGTETSRKQESGDVGPDPRHPFVIRDFLVWTSRWAITPGSPRS